MDHESTHDILNCTVQVYFLTVQIQRSYFKVISSSFLFESI
jgi:hypothetical protein